MARQSVRLNNASPDLQVTFGKSVFFLMIWDGFITGVITVITYVICPYINCIITYYI